MLTSRLLHRTFAWGLIALGAGGVSGVMTRPTLAQQPQRRADAGVSARASGAQPSSPVEPATALRYLPTDCDTSVYIDVGAVASMVPAQKNRELIRARAEMLLENYPEFARTARLALDAMRAEGVDWRNAVNQAGSCMKAGQPVLLTVAGAFANADPVRAIASASARTQSSVELSERDGQPYAVIDRRFHITQLAPGVLGIAANFELLQQARSAGPTLEQRGGQPSDWVFVKTEHPAQLSSIASLTPAGDAFVLSTVERKKTGSFDPAKDRPRAREYIDGIVKRVRSTPLAPVADALQRTDVVFDGDRLTTRTVIPKAAVEDAIARAAVSQRNDWNALLPRRGVGGGPSPGQPQQPHGR